MIKARREAVFTDPGVIYNVGVEELGQVTLENMPDTSDAEAVQLWNETEPESQDLPRRIVMRSCITGLTEEHLPRQTVLLLRKVSAVIEVVPNHLGNYLR